MAELSITLTADSAGEVEILGHNGDTLGVNGAQVGVLEEADKVCFSSFLEGQHCLALEPDVLLELHGDLPHESLEWKLPDEKVGLSYRALKIKVTNSGRTRVAQ